jgi:hypothetical protein
MQLQTELLKQALEQQKKDAAAQLELMQKMHEEEERTH